MHVNNRSGPKCQAIFFIFFKNKSAGRLSPNDYCCVVWYRITYTCENNANATTGFIKNNKKMWYVKHGMLLCNCLLFRVLAQKYRKPLAVPPAIYYRELLSGAMLAILGLTAAARQCIIYVLMVT